MRMITNKKKYLTKIYYLGLWGVLALPGIARAWSPGQPLVPPCARTENPTPGGCHFDDIIILIDNLLDAFIWVTIPVATILFAYIGWILITESDKSSARSDAKNKIIALGKGMFLVLAAWLIVKVIVGGLGIKSGFNEFIVD